MRRPNLDFVRQFFGNLKLTGFYSVGLLDLRRVIIQLSNDPDYNRVFSGKILLYKQLEESPIVPIWISFPNLRLHFFIHEFYMHLVLFLIDQATAPKTRPLVATVLVEVDITKKHAKKIWVGSE
ncbi:hypothetical protein IEQ34_006798 [Dendrobium chrysotoxum]|uniref:DUF4283 domain-containing protein n=1 Tax=Dendrobium chrysotoxum TaxID=161865 RepID=A0AAV7H821_DENCH|nr:hypothetical protein IEQ34_006798 [Dendrobium chrysotoxum]